MKKRTQIKSISPRGHQLTWRELALFTGGFRSVFTATLSTDGSVDEATDDGGPP